MRNEEYGGVPSFVKYGAATIAALFFLTIVLSCFYTVDQGDRGVILNNGAVAGEAEPGLHFKTPLVTRVVEISVQQQKDGFDQGANGDQKWDNRLQAYSRDQQPATIALSVTYHATNVSEVYAQYGGLQGVESRLIDPKVKEQLKNIFGQFDAADAIQKRATLNAQVQAAIKASVVGPVNVDSVQIEDITFSTQYEQAVEARMGAIVKQQQAEADKAKRMIDADAAKYEKEANADASLYTAQAEAKGIEAKGTALRDNPQIVALTTAQRWDGVLPTTMVPGSTVPFLDVRK